MDYATMAQGYLEEVARLDWRIAQLRQEGKTSREGDLWPRIGKLLEIRDDLRVTAHVLQRRAARSL